jgi:arsenate reductase-like glutaredoxin family protein
MGHEQKTIEYYAHDYRGMGMTEDILKEMLQSFVESLNCTHVCTSDCRRVGCNCDCGEYHF